RRRSSRPASSEGRRMRELRPGLEPVVVHAAEEELVDRQAGRVADYRVDPAVRTERGAIVVDPFPDRARREGLEAVEPAAHSAAVQDVAVAGRVLVGGLERRVERLTHGLMEG